MVPRVSGGQRLSGGCSGVVIPHNEFAPIARGDAPFTGEDGLAGQNMDSDYSGRPLPELTEAEVRRAAAAWREPPAGDGIVLDGGLRVAFGRNAWYEVAPNSARIDFGQAGRREPPSPPRSVDPTSGTQPGTRSPAAAPPDPGISRFVISLLNGHAQLPRPNASAIRTAGSGWTKPRAARNTNSAASAVSREAVRGGAVPPPETLVFEIDEQVEHGVHRQPGQRGADTETC